MVASLPMKSSPKRKCCHCKELYLPDYRNRHHQRFCPKPGCRAQSKADSQRRWQQKPQNQNYFSGAENSTRVRQWRQRNPGYWRKKKSVPEEPLQDLCPTQAPQNEVLVVPDLSDALQDLCFLQPAVLVGLISTMTGSALQEDIAAATRALLRKGRDILGPRPGVQNPVHDYDQASPVSAAASPRAAPV
jgi:hypothetical protein